jgi:hypothetical protein
VIVEIPTGCIIFSWLTTCSYLGKTASLQSRRIKSYVLFFVSLYFCPVINFKTGGTKMSRDGYYIELITDVMRSNAKSLLNHRLFDRYSEDRSTNFMFCWPASLYNLVNKGKLVHSLFLVYLFLTIFINFYMFRGTTCPSSGETVFMPHLLLVILCGWLSGTQGGMKCRINTVVSPDDGHIAAGNV